ncbi:MAG: hypothetical protein HY363_06140 [Candidatus Aenigmarchaeota archaeon]|nr:hypothetical protein [Candidatus Aenigmarchaeota archaeon]
MFNGNVWSPTANFFLEITGRQAATIETIPSGNPQELANQCQLIANQIMQLFREKKADKAAIHPGFIEGCQRVNVGLPAVMPFISFEKAEAEKKREEEKQIEEERKKAPPVELDLNPSKDVKEMTAQCKNLAEQIMQIFREKKGERVAVHPKFIENCPQVDAKLPEIMEIVPNKALLKKLEEKLRTEEEKKSAEDARKKAEETRVDAEKREEITQKAKTDVVAAQQKLQARLEEQRKAEERRLAELTAKTALIEEKTTPPLVQQAVPVAALQQVAPVITTPPAPLPKGVKREIEPPEKWVNEYFKFK